MLSALLVVRIIFAAVEVYLVTQLLRYCPVCTPVVQFIPNSSWSGAARHLTCDLLLLDAAVQTVHYRQVLSVLHVVRISHVLRITSLQPLCTIVVCILYNSRMLQHRQYCAVCAEYY